MLVEIILILKEPETRRFKDLFVGTIKNLPVMIPLRNIYLFWQMKEIKYSDPMEASQQTRLEKIKMKGGQRSLTEAFAVNYDQSLNHDALIIETM